MVFRRDKTIRSPEALTAEGDSLLIGLKGEQSFEEALWYYRKAAARDYAPAVYRVGCMYESGHGVKQSYKDAYRWYDKASEMGDRDAKAALAFLYESGLGCKRSRPLAIEHLETASKAGSNRACNNLGLIYQDRGSPEFSDHASVTLFQRANLNHYPPSTSNLARMYETGKGLNRNCETASNLFRTAAKAGNLPAKVFLAEMLKYGIGIDMNQSAAAHLFMEAARWGDPVAIAEVNGEDVEMEDFVVRPDKDPTPRVQLTYGLMFLFGCRAPYAPETAFYLLESAAEAGNTTAMYVLGQAYEIGIGTDKSFFMARKWYSWGADKGNGPCAYVLGCMYEDGKGCEKDPSAAITMYRKSIECQQDDDAMSDALCALGYLLAQSKDTEDEAIDCLKKSSELGHPEAQYFAGKLLLSRNSTAEAMKYLKMAAEQGDDRAKDLLASI